MQKRLTLWVILVAILVWLPVSPAPAAIAPEPIDYTLRFPSPEAHHAEIEAAFPARGRASIELMMPIWSPGFYRVEDYASRIQSLSARAPDGKTLKVEQPQKNRWLIQTNGAPRVNLFYRLLCNGRSVTTNWVSHDL